MNKLKMLEKYLLQKDMSSALNYLSLYLKNLIIFWNKIINLLFLTFNIFSIKDAYIINDFITNIFFFDETQKYNLRLDDLLIILQIITTLLYSKKNIHRKNALNSGLKFLKIVSEVKLIFL